MHFGVWRQGRHSFLVTARENCPQRAEPPLTRTWPLDENTLRTTAFVFSNAREL